RTFLGAQGVLALGVEIREVASSGEGHPLGLLLERGAAGVLGVGRLTLYPHQVCPHTSNTRVRTSERTRCGAARDQSATRGGSQEECVPTRDSMAPFVLRSLS